MNQNRLITAIKISCPILNQNFKGAANMDKMKLMAAKIPSQKWRPKSNCVYQKHLYEFALKH